LVGSNGLQTIAARDMRPVDGDQLSPDLDRLDLLEQQPEIGTLDLERRDQPSGIGHQPLQAEVVIGRLLEDQRRGQAPTGQRLIRMLSGLEAQSPRSPITAGQIEMMAESSEGRDQLEDRVMAERDGARGLGARLRYRNSNNANHDNKLVIVRFTGR
jgi:hypothetical protein